MTNDDHDFILSKAAEEAIATFGDNSVIFIIDDAHLATATTIQLVKYWQSIANGSQLLILARKTKTFNIEWRSDPEFADLGLPQHELVVGSKDLEGVYWRLVQRIGAGERLPPVSDTVIQGWHRLFGGDLFAFSAAILRRLRDRAWDLVLEPSDASDYVKYAYLRELTSVESKALITLAALSEKEILLPVDPFGDNVFCGLITRGIAWVDTKGRFGEHTFARLAHPGLGHLLLEAAASSDEAPNLRLQALVNHPFAAFCAARIMAIEGEEDSRLLVVSVWTTHRWPLALCGFAYWKSFIELTIAAGAVDGQSVRVRAKAWLEDETSHRGLANRALQTPLGDLASFLTFARSAMPEVATVVAKALAEEHNRAALVQLASQTPLGHLASFLTFARSAMPEVATVVVKALAEEHNRAALLLNFLEGGPENIVSFCRAEPNFEAIVLGSVPHQHIELSV